MNSCKCVIGLGDAEGMAGFNRFLADVCGIDLRLLREQRSGPSGRDINRLYQSKLPFGFSATQTPQMCMRMFLVQR